MKELKRATIIFLSFLVLITLVSVVLAFVPVRQRQVDVPKGFYYGEATNQVSTQDVAKFTRKWYGFPATVAEKEVVSYARGNYESATYDIQRFSAFYAVVNVVFWLGLVAALLAPVTIFYRPQKKTSRSEDAREENRIPGESRCESSGLTQVRAYLALV